MTERKIYAVFPPEKIKGGEGVTMNVLMYNYQYYFNTQHNNIINLYSNKKLLSQNRE